MPDNAYLLSVTNLNGERLVVELKQVLQETIFSSGLLISPHRINQVAQEVAASFSQFLEKEDEAAIGRYGHDLAHEGLGHHSILSLCEALRRACWESSNSASRLLPVSGRYVGALLEGYMAEREAFLLQEQERTRKVFYWAREQVNHNSAPE